METHGRFAVYKGIEYFAYKTKQGIMLTSDDEASTKQGFTRNVFDTHYELEVSLAEVEKYYNKQLWGTYMGHDFQVICEKGDSYTLWSCLDLAAVELNFDNVGKYEYEKTVSKSELSRVWWEVKDLLGNED